LYLQCNVRNCSAVHRGPVRSETRPRSSRHWEKAILIVNSQIKTERASEHQQSLLTCVLTRSCRRFGLNKSSKNSRGYEVAKVAAWMRLDVTDYKFNGYSARKNMFSTPNSGLTEAFIQRQN
jgi:hypothetical protein